MRGAAARPPAAGESRLPAPAGAPRGRLYYGWVLVLTLGVTETVSWGVLYYAFSVFVLPMEAELGWSRGDISGAFSLGVLLSGAAAVPVGRWIDVHGARALMTAGSCAGTLLVLAWSGVHSLPAFYAIWAAIGVTLAAVLYDPAFAVVTTWFHRRRAQALTALTLMAGLASTIFLPLAGWLVEVQGWRAALVSLAVILGLTTIAPHALLLRRAPEDIGQQPDGGRAGPDGDEARGGGARPAVARRGLPLREVIRLDSFPLVSGAFFLYTLASSGVSVHLVPYLVDAGYGPGVAATLTGAVGAMQLAGRLLFAPLERRLARRYLNALVFLVQPLALLVLLLVPNLAGVVVFVALFGASRGAATLARATSVAGLYGPSRYASISGVLTLFVTLAQAAAPLAMGVGHDAFDAYEPVLWLLAALAVAAAVAVLLSERSPRSPHGTAPAAEASARQR